MNLKKMWKRFWTMNVHNHEGFTLVELIIVIAILAILSSVAVVGYSSYVTKANMQADKTLVSEIQNALTLAYYNGDISESGYVVLTMNGVPGTSTASNGKEEVKTVLTSAFGNLGNLKLKHNGWAEGGNFGSYASSVNGSFVTNGTDVLLEDLEGCTGKLAEFMVGSNLFKGQQGATRLDNLLQADGSVSGMLNGYEDDEIDETVLANATVFGVAASLSNSTNAETVINDFANMQYLMNSINTSDVYMLAKVAHKYAALEAFVNYMNCQGATDALNDFNANGMNSTDPTAIVTNLDTACRNAWNAVFMDTSNQTAFLKGMEYYGMMLNEDEMPVANPNVTKSPARQDGEAYVSTMLAVDSLSTDYAGSLGNAGMFTDGTLTGDLNTYLNLAADIPTEGAYYVVSFRIDENGINFDE